MISIHIQISVFQSDYIKIRLYMFNDQASEYFNEFPSYHKPTSVSDHPGVPPIL